jgi:hypothetical protein
MCPHASAPQVVGITRLCRHGAVTEHDPSSTVSSSHYMSWSLAMFTPQRGRPKREFGGTAIRPFGTAPQRVFVSRLQPRYARKCV